MGRSAAPFTARAALGIVYFRADLLLLTALVGFGAAGIYQAAYKVFELALVIPGAANAAAYPVISAYLSASRMRAARAYQRLLGGMLALGLPLTALLFVGASPLIHVLYGRAYLTAAPMLAVLAGAVLLSYVNAAPITVLSALPRQAALTAVTASGLVVNLALNLVLIPRFSGQGAALAMIASEVVQCVFLFVLATRIMRGIRVARRPQRLMVLGFALSVALFYGPRAVFGVALVPVWLAALPGFIVYAVGVVRYVREILGEMKFGPDSGVWETIVAQPPSGARP
jgi:O-antigen/teichoic acid export membrane protein